MENQTVNPLLCDIETGLCELPAAHSDLQTEAIAAGNQPIRVIYYTDPICSSCWGIEPALRKLKLQYGKHLDIEYRMGGLLPDWSYNSGGISKPSDVASHWDEVSLHYDMPIDGDVWLEDPLSSSYPASIAFKAAQVQDEALAIRFLRKIREMVFLQKKNISEWQPLSEAARAVGLDVVKLKKDYAGKAKALFNEDLELGRKLGVRGFPTMFFLDSSGNKERVYGSQPYTTYEQAITRLYPAAGKFHYDHDWLSLFTTYPTLTSREFAELSDMPRQAVDHFLQQLVDDGALDKLVTKNGVLWLLTSQ
ncbi:ClpXP adapter SpxH family protein [Paraflavitalea pollutisoli]|uniref:ClpXP adapter SpxH family protein n=1 Tax=Paraflavitalea pollutisoli TaxID=3034143 RepID=UPI0023ECBDB5|nr:ClpXP adapter SpxH family protein [Paraflavitalea sp. H1-2-19X]